ncbi:Oxysterol-binding C2F12.05c [Gossypium australe]|uniref:Oxysterol-binding C2F12.05c n=1 Tax=Gossypium australe TaxID=47621 RepID=A0A5B6X5X4_9ROSI|nr:Oxysterol-binding C2F12.05c [Gossypium australe]
MGVIPYKTISGIWHWHLEVIPYKTISEIWHWHLEVLVNESRRIDFDTWQGVGLGRVGGTTSTWACTQAV